MACSLLAGGPFQPTRFPPKEEEKEEEEKPREEKKAEAKGQLDFASGTESGWAVEIGTPS